MEPMPQGPVPVSPQHTSTQAPGQVFIERRLRPGPGLCTASSPGNEGSAAPPQQGRQPQPCLCPPQSTHGCCLFCTTWGFAAVAVPTRFRRRGEQGRAREGPSAGHRARVPQGQPATSWGAWLKVHGRRAAASLTGAPADPCPPTAAPPSPPPGTGSCRHPRAAGAVPPGAAGSLRRAAVSGQRAGRGPPPTPGHD